MSIRLPSQTLLLPFLTRTDASLRFSSPSFRPKRSRNAPSFLILTVYNYDSNALEQRRKVVEVQGDVRVLMTSGRAKSTSRIARSLLIFVPNGSVAPLSPRGGLEAKLQIEWMAPRRFFTRRRRCPSRKSPLVHAGVCSHRNHAWPCC